MEKKIHFYLTKSRKDDFPAILFEMFKEHFGGGGVFFEDGTEKEQKFLELCDKYKLKINKHEYLKCSGKELFNYPFYYLNVKPFGAFSKKKFYDDDFMENDGICSKCRCETIERKQIKKIIIDSSVVNNIDILELGNFMPRVYLISKKLKILFETLDTTGGKFIPCIEKGNQFDDLERDLFYDSKSLEEKASYFQLYISERVINPPYAGTYDNIFPVCRKCKIHTGGYASVNPFFNKLDLNNTDFQKYSEYITDNYGKIKFFTQFTIISLRVFRLLVENKVKGLSRFWDFPPIKYGVVPIKE